MFVSAGAAGLVAGLVLLGKEVLLSREEKKRRRGEKVLYELLNKDADIRGQGIVLAIWQTIFGALVIGTIEDSIADNDINMSAAGLTSTGQLIPFIAGVEECGISCTC